MPDISFERLTSDRDTAFEDFYRIYIESISYREQKSKTQIAEMVSRPDYKFLLLKRNGQTIGFSILFLPKGFDFALLEYMAVAQEFRNGGLGAKLFQRSIEAVSKAKLPNEKSLPTLLEVDSAGENSSPSDLNYRRLQFYRRLGCLRVNTFSYILPLPGTGPPPDMQLMIYTAEGVESIPKSSLDRWIKEIYKSVYNCSPDDPRIAHMLDAVSDPVPLT